MLHLYTVESSKYLSRLGRFFPPLFSIDTLVYRGPRKMQTEIKLEKGFLPLYSFHPLASIVVGIRKPLESHYIHTSALGGVCSIKLRKKERRKKKARCLICNGVKAAAKPGQGESSEGLARWRGLTTESGGGCGPAPMEGTRNRKGGRRNC